MVQGLHGYDYYALLGNIKRKRREKRKRESLVNYTFGGFWFFLIVFPRQLKLQRNT